MENWVLSFIFWTPLLGALLVLFPLQKKFYRFIAIGILSLELLWIALMLYYAYFDLGVENLLLSQRHLWWELNLGEYGLLRAEYFLGVDKKNILLVALSGIILWAGAIASFRIKRQERLYFLLYLVLSTAVMGTFLALDFLLFFICFEFMLLPMYFLIGLWGGKKREYAAIKFFIYTLIGSILILIAGIIVVNSGIDVSQTADLLEISVSQVLEQLADKNLATKSTVRSFDMLAFAGDNFFQKDSLLQASDWRLLVFVLLLVGFAIKLPIAPLHTWLPIAHVEATTPISMILAGILLKIGGYGLLRLPFAIFSDVAQEWSFWLSCWGVFSIIYGAFLALGQTHLKRLIAYSSVSHMGFVLLALAAINIEGTNGAIFQMVSHGVISPLLFLLVGVLYYQTKELNINHYSGLWRKLPRYTTLIALSFFAGLGLPTFSSFIAEITILLGIFSSEFIPVWIPILAVMSLVLTAGYFLWAFKRMFLGETWLHTQLKSIPLSDIEPKERALAALLIFLSVLMGVLPQIIFMWLV